MKIIITAKTGKGEKSTEREIDKTVDMVVNLANTIKGKPKFIRPIFYPDGTSIIIKK